MAPSRRRRRCCHWRWSRGGTMLRLQAPSLSPRSPGTSVVDLARPRAFEVQCPYQGYQQEHRGSAVSAHGASHQHAPDRVSNLANSDSAFAPRHHTTASRIACQSRVDESAAHTHTHRTTSNTSRSSASHVARPAGRRSGHQPSNQLPILDVKLHMW